jgi:hypothetical protein
LPSLDTEFSLGVFTKFSFLKRKASGADIGLGYYDHLRKNYAAELPTFLREPPTDPAIGSDSVRHEWLYLKIFAYDFSVYLALGNTPARAAVLTSFWQHIETWLQAEHVAALPERFAGVVGDEVRFIPAEPSESSYTRLRRRVQEYSSAIKSPHHMGENYSVAAVFADACGFMNIVLITAVSAYFSSSKIENVQFIRKFRIVT